ncbi:GNAT family N-acetyltransferase [Streptomyces pathocidini]|uniref:GNAT family N-acetyltransferase n=1 Tax=Streptomyces pathocidini TaxID=1650571 RepID=UPI0033FBDB08
MQIRATPFDHPDAVQLNDAVQLEYQRRYDGEGDITPLDASMFTPPNGLYLIAYDEGNRPVATGGWRAHEEAELGYSEGDAEIKRMYVIPEARGLGLARRILAELEAGAREAGRARMVLETGTRQPEAIALYTSSGYTPCERFGHFREYEDSRCFAKPLNGAIRPGL